MKIKFFIPVLFISVLVAGLSRVVHAQTVSYSPTRLFFKGNPGETISQVVTVFNSGTESYEFVPNMQDWKRDSIGEKEYADPGTLPLSNAKSISLSSTNIKVVPGGKTSFTVTMQIPTESKTGSKATNSMLFLRQSNPREAKNTGNSAIGIQIAFELGVQIFYTPNTAKPGELNFSKFEYQDHVLQEAGAKRLAVKFDNTGEMNKDGNIRFELTNKQTGEEIKMKPIPIAIMPNDSQWVYCPLEKDMAEGTYLVVAMLDAGANFSLKVAEKEIYVKK